MFSPEEEVCPSFKSWLSERAVMYEKPGIKLTNKSVNNEILFNYYVRNKPKHIWNKDRIRVSDNFYSSTPKYGFPPQVAWLLLNSDLYSNCLLKNSRNQGSGLVKLQLFEYKNTLVPNWNNLSCSIIEELKNVANTLIEANSNDVFEVQMNIQGKY